jgi:NTE family protein
LAEEKVALVLAGGVGLGAYQAGAYEAIPEALRRRLGWIAGSSIGAVNGAILAGNPPGERQTALSRFWDGLARENSAPVPNLLRDAVWARPFSRLNVAATRVFGRASLFSPLIPPLRPDALGLYRLDGMRGALRQYVDFDRLNGGDVRLSVSATDLASGDWVTFDTGRGDRIGEDQILASCGFLPDFEPTEVDGRLLGDGALAANAPVEAVLEHAGGDEDLTVFVIDLFARDVGPPRGLVDALELRLDLLLASPTHRALDLAERNDALLRQLAMLLDRLPADARKGGEVAAAEQVARRGALRVLHLSYRAGPAEAGSEKQFDFSRASIDRRREAGRADMAAALERSEPAAKGWQRHTVRRVPLP